MIELNSKNIITIILGIIVFVLFVHKIFNYRKPDNSLSTFDNSDETPKFVNFNTTWCYWSKKLSPTWEELKSEMNGKDVEIVDLKCDVEGNEELCARYQIEGYPSMKLIQGNNIIDYEGDRSLEDMKNFIESNVNY